MYAFSAGAGDQASILVKRCSVMPNVFVYNVGIKVTLVEPTALRSETELRVKSTMEHRHGDRTCQASPWLDLVISHADSF
jgi:hypothetical protein